MAARRIDAVIVDDDTPEPLPAQVQWLDRAPPVELKDGRYVAILAIRWAQCRCGFIVPEQREGRYRCNRNFEGGPCGGKPAIRLSRAVISSVTEAKVTAEVQRVQSIRPRDYFATEGTHFVDLDVA